MSKLMEYIYLQECLQMIVKMRQQRSILHLLLTRYKKDASKEDCLHLLFEQCDEKESPVYKVSYLINVYTLNLVCAFETLN